MKSDDKKRARLNAMRYVLRSIPYAHRDLKAIGPVDPLIVGRASAMFETAENRGNGGQVMLEEVLPRTAYLFQKTASIANKLTSCQRDGRPLLRGARF